MSGPTCLTGEVIAESSKAIWINAESYAICSLHDVVRAVESQLNVGVIDKPPTAFGGFRSTGTGGFVTAVVVKLRTADRLDPESLTARTRQKYFVLADNGPTCFEFWVSVSRRTILLNTVSEARLTM